MGKRAVMGPIAALCAAVLMVGCADDPPDAVRGPNGGAAVPNGDVVEVDALDNSFRAEKVTIVAGTKVVFTNVGRNDHNVLPQPDSTQGWGVGEQDFAPGAVYEHVFTEPGTYAYICTIHGVKGKGMVGTIVVTAAG